MAYDLMVEAIRRKNMPLLQQFHIQYKQLFHRDHHDKPILFRTVWNFHLADPTYHAFIDQLIWWNVNMNNHDIREIFLNAILNDDETLFDIAMTENNGIPFRSLLCHVTRVELIDNVSYNILHSCVRHSRYNMVKKCLHKKTLYGDAEYFKVDDHSITEGDSYEKREDMTSLHLAAKNNDVKMIELLLEEKANPVLTDIWGRTCEDIATEEKAKAVCEAAIESKRAKYRVTNVYNGGKMESVDIREKAIIRLLRDLKEMIEEPLPNVRAVPIETDIFQWHVILTPPPRPTQAEQEVYPFTGIRFHMVMKFPQDYPRSPPELVVSTHLPHPFVFEKYIRREKDTDKVLSNFFVCLDMLQAPRYGTYDWDTGKHRKYEGGWSSAYTAQSVLIQLQAFLFDENIPIYHTYSIHNRVGAGNREEAYLQAKEYECRECGYNYTFPGVDLRSSRSTMLDKVEVEEDTSVVGGNDYHQKQKGKRNARKKADNSEDTKPIQVENQFLRYDPNRPLQPPKTNQRKEIGEMINHLQKIPQAKMPLIPYNGPCFLLQLPQEIIIEIYDYLTHIDDVSSMYRTCVKLRDIGWKYSVWTRRELNCYFSKRSFHEDIMGIGLSVQRHKDKKLKTLSSPLDLISRTAFLEDEVRKSAWREPFDYWLPLPISARHSKFAMPLVKAMLTAISKNVDFTPKDRKSHLEQTEGPTVDELAIFYQRMNLLENQFQPEMVLQIIPKLMNHMIVAIMKESGADQAGSSGILPLHASEKALLGYCSYHHILLNLVNEFPILQEKVDRTISDFVSHVAKRNKIVTPDLGELLVLLTLSTKYSWEDISQVFLQECFDRNVVWILDEKHGAHPELCYLEKEPISQYRLETTMKCSQTSLRLVMFQSFFLRFVGNVGNLSIKMRLDRYNDSYGHPPRGVPEKLCWACRKICQVRSWEDFYLRLGLPAPSRSEMTSILRNAVINSENKGYHVTRCSQEDLFRWREKVDPEILQFGTLKDGLMPELGKKAVKIQHEIQVEKDVSAPKILMSLPKHHVKCYVGNLAYRVDDQKLAFLFKQYGHISFAKIAVDPAGKSRGFGFVAFDDPAVGRTAARYTRGYEYLDGRSVKIREISNIPRIEDWATLDPNQFFVRRDNVQVENNSPVEKRDGKEEAWQSQDKKKTNNKTSWVRPPNAYAKSVAPSKSKESTVVSANPFDLLNDE
eukprot:TRINITY_DN2538_c1_g1_i2.p1 TRINITY_DN2538_c1_g1~~TRINITY_DN2538_c1_g1_i2.p1  ORF type:complete len:1193 (-),score=425.36 TRINITY_DN2538_c1_g1_i2:218-3796(-)